VTEFSHVFENLFIVDLLLRWCFVVLLLHDFLFVVVLVANPKDGTLKVTSDQAQQNLARKVCETFPFYSVNCSGTENFYQYVWFYQCN